MFVGSVLLSSVESLAFMFYVVIHMLFLELCGICYHINFDCLFLKSFCIHFIVSFSRHRYFHFSLPTFIYQLEWKD